MYIVAVPFWTPFSDHTAAAIAAAVLPVVIMKPITYLMA